MTREEKNAMVPVWEKVMLTVEEASAYSGIGTSKLRELSDYEDCKFVLWVGNKRMFKRERLMKFLENEVSI